MYIFQLADALNKQHRRHIPRAEGGNQVFKMPGPGAVCVFVYPEFHRDRQLPMKTVVCLMQQCFHDLAVHKAAMKWMGYLRPAKRGTGPFLYARPSNG